MKRKLCYLVLMLAFVSNTVFSRTQKPPKPTTLDEAIAYLDTIFADSVTTTVQNMTEDQFTANYHFSLGMSMRDNWGLWKGSPLSKHFKSMGIHHPDDMSGIILTSFHRKLQGKEIDLQGQVRKIRAYWRANSVPVPAGYPDGVKKLKFTARYGYAASDSLPGMIHVAEVPRKKEYWLYDINRGWKQATRDQLNELDKTGENRKEWIESFYRKQ
ncbi:MAG: hypothetical protein J7527_05125 [Chitinophagaceae bacterium]|nr:hypothetical protein [Chitinophagaceae bacterium]